jgi:hypothetical protein
MVENIIKQNEKIKQELVQVVSRFFEKRGESPTEVRVKMIVPRDGGVIRIQITIKD